MRRGAGAGTGQRLRQMIDNANLDSDLDRLGRTKGVVPTTDLGGDR